jgi:hypothetical protein
MRKNKDEIGNAIMTTPSRRLLLVAVLATTGAVFVQTGGACAQSSGTETLAAQEAALPENPLKEAYFGETHVHTSYSLDAYIGGARLTPSDAYRFAKGHTVVVSGKPHNIGRPLDFAAISDHAEFLGEMYSTHVPGAPGHDQEALDELRNLQTVADQSTWFGKYVRDNMRSDQPGHPPFFVGPETTESGWQIEIDAAREHYDPGVFTTIVGYEWTSAPNGGNMHRNLLFRDMNLPALPLSALDTQDEEKLWEWMRTQEEAGMRLLAIPHNSNASKGQMFEPVDNAGAPIDLEYAETRGRFERLIEMMQIKGNSEVHRSLWPADEFADFENGDSINTFSGRERIKQNYVRWAVIKGLDYQGKLGANPYQLGFVGGTDNHNGAPADVVEDNYTVGSHGPFDGTVEARREGEIEGWILSKDSNPARSPVSGHPRTPAPQSGMQCGIARRS